MESFDTGSEISTGNDNINKLLAGFASIGLKPDLSFLLGVAKDTFGNMVEQYKMEIEYARADLDKGKKVFWCQGKKMIMGENDCASPNNQEGCHRWDKKLHICLPKPKEKPVELAEPKVEVLGKEGLLEVLSGENAEEEGDHIKRLKEDFERKMRKMEEWADQRK